MATSFAAPFQGEPWTPRSAAGEPGAYLTDGWRLFRVVTPLQPAEGRRAQLEDCYTLETRAYDPYELWTMQLRKVYREAAAA